MIVTFAERRNKCEFLHFDECMFWFLMSVSWG